MTPPLLEVDLSAAYAEGPEALTGVRFSVTRGEIFGIAGPSGSGKSTLALVLLGLLGLRGGRVSGRLCFEGRGLTGLREHEWRSLRGREIAFVPQSPMTALNPALSLESHFREAWRAHSREPWQSVRSVVMRSMCDLGLPADDRFLRRLPQQVSVGQAQRVLIAMSVLHQPKLLIADEPTSALDPESQAGILDLFRRLRVSSGVAAVYISHDIRSLATLADRVGILNNGRLIRTGPAEEVLGSPVLPGHTPLVDGPVGDGQQIRLLGPHSQCCARRS
jgi:ABC-type glutathione transport system ATPase component